MGSVRRSVAVLAMMLGGIVLLPTAASADTGAAGRDFSAHVVMCAQTMGFNGQHNPGMHHGFAGWDPTHMC